MRTPLIGIPALFGAALALQACGSSNPTADPAPAPVAPPDPPPTQAEPTPAPDEGGPVATGAAIAGPLDSVEDILTGELFARLAAPLESVGAADVTLLAGELITGPLINLVDAAANAVQGLAGGESPSSVLSDTTEATAAQLGALSEDLRGLLCAAVDLDTRCTLDSIDALQDTPLAPAAALLVPTLDTVDTVLSFGIADAGTPAGLAHVNGLLGQLSVALDTTLAALPAEVADSLIVGDTLQTTAIALDDLSDTLVALTALDAAATEDALLVTVNNLLTQVLTEIVPLAQIDQSLGLQGSLDQTVDTGIDAIVGVLDDGLTTALPAVLENAVSQSAGNLIPEAVNVALDTLVTELYQATDTGQDPLAFLLEAAPSLIDAAATGVGALLEPLPPVDPLPVEPIAPEPADPLPSDPVVPEPVDPLPSDPVAPEPIDPLPSDPVVPEPTDPLPSDPVAPEPIDPLPSDPVVPEPTEPLPTDPVEPPG